VIEFPFRPDPGAPEPLHRQLADALRGAIVSGRLAAGQKLPATRELALDTGLGRNTVLRAYEALCEAGLARAHVGQGTFVAAGAGAGPAGAAPGARRPFAWEGLFSLRSRAAGPPPALLPMAGVEPRFDFRPGQVDLASLPVAALQRAFGRALGRGLRKLANHGSPEGWRPLRAAIARALAARGIACGEDEVLVTSGAQQALDLVARTLVDPGDVVAMEEPGYFGAAMAFRACQAHVVGVGVDAEGLRTGELARLLRTRRVKALFTTPAVQSPTGVTLSDARRRELLSLADAHQVPVVEDDYDAELRMAGPVIPALKTLDRAGQVVYLGTFSKALFGGLRIGYVVADRALRRRLRAARLASDLHGATVTEAAAAELLESGALERHVRRVRRRYLERRTTLLSCLHRVLPEGSHVVEPAGGTSVWVTLPGSFDADALQQEALRLGVAYARGDAFSLDGGHARSLLLSYATLFPDQIESGSERLAEAVRKVLGTSARAAARPRARRNAR